MVKRSFAALFGIVLAFVLSMTLIAVPADAAQENELCLMCEKESDRIEGMHWSIYRVGERAGSGFILTGNFADYPVSLDDITEENVRGIAQALESFAAGDGLSADDDGYTDKDGTVSFSGLDPGLYLAVPEKLKAGKLEYRSVSLLAEITDSDETVFPKIYSSIVAGREVRDYTVKKVWQDQDNAGNTRPASVTVDLYGNGRKTDTITLDESNNWQYRWADLDTDTEWRVVERNIPENYNILIEMDSDQFLIKNISESEIVTTSVTTSTTVTTTVKPGDDLPQTGQLWWPVLALSIGGIVFIGAGLLLRRSSDRNEK